MLSPGLFFPIVWSPVSLQHRGDSPSQQGLQTQIVFDEDLQKKIQENERLHIQVCTGHKHPHV